MGILKPTVSYIHLHEEYSFNLFVIFISKSEYMLRDLIRTKVSCDMSLLFIITELEPEEKHILEPLHLNDIIGNLFDCYHYNRLILYGSFE